MFLSVDAIASSIELLKDLHPFYGTTLLACKSENLPVGRPIPFAISEVETNFLKKYYQTDRSSTFFYTAFVTPVHEKRWISLKKYASSSLQSTRTRSVFKHAFIHEPNSKKWGWQSFYKSVLLENLSENKGQLHGNPIPTLQLATWLFRETDWGERPDRADLIRKFLAEFNFNSEEMDLFNLETEAYLGEQDLFQPERASIENLRRILGDSPDSKPASSGSLASLQIRGVGPADKIDLDAAPRLNLLTGDNGLGKSFILETAWWALTGDWTNENSTAQPDLNAPRTEPRIKFQIATDASTTVESSFRFDWRSGQWVGKRKRNAVAGLTIFARVDGSYAVWDPTGTVVSGYTHNDDELLNGLSTRERSRVLASIRAQEQIILSSREIFEGSSKTEGLIRDWVKWQNRPDRYPFAELCQVLEILSPPDMKALRPGAIQSSLFSHLEVPTIEHPYGDVPITHASAGIRRVISLAYLIVWAWSEHRKVSEMIREDPQRRMVILVDELEAHLHPQWQRTILPALLHMGEALYSDLKIQLIVSTHSPLVMASAETIFDDETDKQFHLDMSPDGSVSFEEKDFVEYGLVDYWLVSPTFNLKYPSSRTAERWIEEAKSTQLQENPTKAEIERISAGLNSALPATDPFWVRWVFFAERHGVEL